MKMDMIKMQLMEYDDEKLKVLWLLQRSWSYSMSHALDANHLEKIMELTDGGAPNNNRLRNHVGNKYSSSHLHVWEKINLLICSKLKVKN